MEIRGIEIRSALVIYAHADDAEYGVAGTVASWVRQGVEVTYCMVTNGASGSNEREMTRERLTQIRAAEQQAACDVLGVARLIQLGFEDGYVEPTLETRKAITRVVRQARPDVIVTPHDPRLRIMQNTYINHPDHIAVGECVLRAMNADASAGLMFPELWREEEVAPWQPKAVLLAQFVGGETLVDITETLDVKVKALACHVSQGGANGEGFVRQVASELGSRLGVPAAEAFDLITTV